MSETAEDRGGVGRRNGPVLPKADGLFEETRSAGVEDLLADVHRHEDHRLVDHRLDVHRLLQKLLVSREERKS